MIAFRLLILVAALIASPAYAAKVITGSVAYSGATVPLTTTGYSWLTGKLYAPSSPSLLFNTPFTVSFGVKSTTVGSGQQDWIDSRNIDATIPGIIIGALISGSFPFGFPVTAWASSDGTFSPVGGLGPAQNNARAAYLNNGNWHNVCWNVAPSGAQLYIDGALVDDNRQAVNYSMLQATWVVGPGAFGGSFRDIRVYNNSIGALGCRQLATMAQQNKKPSTGALATNFVVHWPMDNCDATGCADTSGGGNNLIYDINPPACTIGAPANNAVNLTGNVTFSAACTDPVGTAGVYFFVDGMAWGSGTGANCSPVSPPPTDSGCFPFLVPPVGGTSTVTVDTTKFIDGAHTWSVVSVNTAGFYSPPVSIAASTLNGITAKTFYVNSSTGSDSNNCLTSGGPCATIPGLQAKLDANPLHGGDSVLFAAGTSYTMADFNWANVFSLRGPAAQASDLRPALPVNAYGGQTITVGTYGGSGQCQILAGITTDCATFTVSSYSGPRNIGAVNFTNVPNMLVQNLRVINGDSVGYNGTTICPATGVVGCNAGIRYVVDNNFSSGAPTAALGATTIQNTEAVNFYMDIALGGQVDPGGSINGNVCGALVQDNYAHGVSVTSPGANGIWPRANDCQQPTQLSPIQSSAMRSNVVTNIGGLPLDTGSAGFGGGINYSPGNVFVDMKFNVSSALCNLCRGSGNGYPFWDFDTNTITYLGNEAYNVYPAIASIVDAGGIDLDGGTSNAVVEFNYIHEVNGSGAGGFNFDDSGFLMQNDLIAYNIIENAGTNGNQGFGAVLNGIGGHGPTYEYNNSVWNGFQGQNTPSTGAFIVNNAAFSNQCQTDTLVNPVANNIFISNARNSSPTTDATMMTGGPLSTTRICRTLTFIANDWFPLQGRPMWWGYGQSTINIITTLAAWNAWSGEAGISVTPNFAGITPVPGTGTPGAATGINVTCYPGTGIPVQPICATNYFQQSGSALIGTGVNLTLAPYSLTLPATDFYNGAIPNGVGTGYNYGADGAHH